jgi:hypothetical protein
VPIPSDVVAEILEVFAEAKQALQLLDPTYPGLNSAQRHMLTHGQEAPLHAAALLGSTDAVAVVLTRPMQGRSRRLLPFPTLFTSSSPLSEPPCRLEQTCSNTEPSRWGNASTTASTWEARPHSACPKYCRSQANAALNRRLCRRCERPIKLSLIGGVNGEGERKIDHKPLGRAT